MSEQCVYANATPDPTQKARYVRGEREVEMEERGEDEDRGEREERIVDIYVTADDLRPVAQQGAVPQNTAQAQHGGSAEPKNNRSRAAAGCVGTLCLLLLAAVIGLVIHNNNLVKRLDQLELQTTHDLTEQKVMFQELQTQYNNLRERDDLKKRLCESPGWQKFGCGYYYVSTEEKNWEESRQYCQDNQSDLMVINSGEKQDFLHSLNQRVWLGLTDSEEENTWKWVDGSPLSTPTYWASSEPNNNGLAPNTEEDCAEILNGRWNDRSCVEPNHWICEIVIY